MEKEENPKIEESKEGKQGVIPSFRLRELELFGSLDTQTIVFWLLLKLASVIDLIDYYTEILLFRMFPDFCKDNLCIRSTYNLIKLIIMPVLKPSSNWNIYLYAEHILKNLRRGLSALDYWLACFGHSAICSRITSIGKRGHGVIRHPDGLQSGYD